MFWRLNSTYEGRYYKINYKYEKVAAKIFNVHG